MMVVCTHIRDDHPFVKGVMYNCEIDYQKEINPINPLLVFRLDTEEYVIHIPLRYNMFEIIPTQ